MLLTPSLSCAPFEISAGEFAGVGNVLGNKGGVGVALTYMKHTRLLFVNAHFAAHDNKVAQRQADYLRIKAGLFSKRDEPGVRCKCFH